LVKMSMLSVIVRKEGVDMKRVKQVFLICMMGGLAALGLAVSFWPRQAAEIAEPIAPPSEIFEYAYDFTIPPEPYYDGIARISSNTRMVYEYNYPERGIVERVLDEPSVFLLGMTRDEIDNIFMDWQIVAFSSEEVVLRRDLMVDKNRQFTIGYHEGFIAVFYVNEYDVEIIELIGRPVDTLPIPDQERIREGIEVRGSTELFRILEDFSS